MNDTGPALWGVDCPGTVLKYYGHAAGKGARQAKGMIEKLDLKEMTCAEAVKHIAHIIHKGHDEKDKAFDLEMSGSARRATICRPSCRTRSSRRRRPGRR